MVNLRRHLPRESRPIAYVSSDNESKSIQNRVRRERPYNRPALRRQPVHDAREFYVGYFKMPPRLAMFLRWIVPGLIAIGIVSAWSLARSQNDPGDGVWHDDAQSLVGRIAANPYPLIRVLRNGPACLSKRCCSSPRENTAAASVSLRWMAESREFVGRFSN